MPGSRWEFMVSGLCEMRELTDTALPAGPGFPTDTLEKKKHFYPSLPQSWLRMQCTQQIPEKDSGYFCSHIQQIFNLFSFSKHHTCFSCSPGEVHLFLIFVFVFMF